MAGKVAPSPAAFIISVVMTALTLGLCYWLWQDIKPLLRPLKGDGWRLVKDLQFLINVLGVFLLLSIANFAIDCAGPRFLLTRLVTLVLLVGVALSLVRYGTYFEKTIEPHLETIGFERPAFLKKG